MGNINDTSELLKLLTNVRVDSGSSINEMFNKLKSNLELNDSFDEIIQQHHNAVRGVVENDDDDDIETQLIGSLQRKTRIQPREEDQFDIDILVVLGSFTRWVPVGGVTPRQAMANLSDKLSESDRYSAMSPEEDQPTIHFDYEDGVKVELVPAYRDLIGHSPGGIQHSPVGRAFWVPKHGHWELADYNYDAEYITGQNKSSEGWLIPTIKMLKAIKREHFSEMMSFHLEILAALIIKEAVIYRKQNNLPISYPMLLSDFFTVVQSVISTSISLPNSLSPRVQLELLHQMNVSTTIKNIKFFIDKIGAEDTETGKVKKWKELFGDVFPSS
jgi:hypothetical protein